MVFKKWNIIYPSKKVYNDLKIIEPNISSYYYTPSFYRDINTLNKIKESVNKFKKN